MNKCGGGDKEPCWCGKKGLHMVPGVDGAQLGRGFSSPRGRVGSALDR